MKYLVILLVFPFLMSCSNDDDQEYQNIPIDFQVPSNFPPLAYDLSNNPLTEKGFEQGKKLFYDGRLASDGLVYAVSVTFKKTLLPIMVIR